MFCPQCGQEVQPGSHNCSHCGAQMQADPASPTPPPPSAPPQQPMGGMAPPAPGAPGMPGGGMPGGGMPVGGMPGAYGAPPPNHLVWAILTTIFCCLPLGVVSIIYAAKVNGLAQSGDMAGAMEASKNAKLWAMIGAGIGLIATVGVILLNIIAGVGAMSAGY